MIGSKCESVIKLHQKINIIALVLIHVIQVFILFVGAILVFAIFWIGDAFAHITVSLEHLDRNVKSNSRFQRIVAHDGPRYKAPLLNIFIYLLLYLLINCWLQKDLIFLLVVSLRLR